MRWCSLDPSSTAVGWCLYEPVADKQALIKVHSFGKFTPRGNGSLLRTEAIMGWILQMAPRPDAFLIEIPSGKVNHARNQGGGSGLSVYGFAVGATWAAAKYTGAQVHTATESWTGGFSKSRRKATAVRYAPGYSPATDAGGDVADAICLAAWYHHTTTEGES